MTATAQIEAPDLSHLPYETRVRITVAGTQGWRYRAQSRFDPSIPIGIPPRGAGGVKRDSQGNVALPNYLHDPAAWAPVMIKEMARWETGEFDGERQHRCWWDTGDGVTLTPGPWASDLPYAVCLAFLAKCGVTTNPSLPDA